MAIMRTVRLDEDFVNRPINYVQGTNAVDITIKITGYTIPSDAVANAYIRKPTVPKKTIAYKKCTLKNNSVTFNGGDGFLNTIGENECQIVISKESTTLATFIVPIIVSENFATDSAVPEHVDDSVPVAAFVSVQNLITGTFQDDVKSVTRASDAYFIKGDGTAIANTSLALTSLKNSRITLYVPGYETWGSTRRDIYGSIVSNTVGLGFYTDTDNNRTDLVLRIGSQTINGIPMQTLFTNGENSYGNPIKYELTIVEKKNASVVGGTSSNEDGYHAVLIINNKTESGYTFSITNIPDDALTDATQSFRLFTTGTASYDERYRHKAGTHMISRCIIESLTFSSGSIKPTAKTIRDYRPVVADAKAGLHDIITNTYVYPTSGKFIYQR